jgi:dimethylargininase
VTARVVALTRAVPPSIVRCELTHLAREPIDVARAAAQHEAYERVLASMGCVVRRLPALPEMPDSVFVEDVAVVVDELAVIARPGAASRRGETDSAAAALAEYRPLARIRPPGTLDGGDVLRVGRRVLVGVTPGGRTNAEGAAQLRAALAPLGYEVACVEARGCLHLESAVTAVADDLLLVNPDWVDPAALGARWIAVHPSEPFAANVLRAGDAVLAAAAGSLTMERLAARGLDVRAVDVSELAKAEAGVTCCSILVP